MDEKQKAQIRKRNIKLFPITKSLGWEYLFFTTTNFLFLTQVKNISPANVVLIDSFYALFGIIMQIPAAFVIEYLGRKKSIVFANLLNCAYIIMVMTSINLFNLIIAEMLSSIAFAIKESAEPALLNESIPSSKNKSNIFARINEKGISNWYIINAITTIFAGLFYDINPYIPISLSLVITIFVTIISLYFIEPIEERKTINIKQVYKANEIKEAFRFILKSERLKSLILCSSIITGIITILASYEISLLEELNVSAKILCTIFAIIGIISGVISKKQEKFHKRYKNKTLQMLLIIISISIIFAGLLGIIAYNNSIIILFIVLFYVICNCAKAMFHPLIERYLRNFANDKIDTKIFTAKNFLGSIFSATMGLVASFLLERMNTAYSMTIVGIMSIIITIMLIKYMKKRVRFIT